MRLRLSLLLCISHACPSIENSMPVRTDWHRLGDIAVRRERLERLTLGTKTAKGERRPRTPPITVPSCMAILP